MSFTVCSFLFFCLFIDFKGAFADDKNLLQFSVLPGSGWDNLRNVQMAMVLNLTHETRVTSPDGKYLISNGVDLYSNLRSSVQLSSTIVGHFNNYTSATSGSINVEASGFVHGVNLNGKFGYEHQHMKSEMVSSKTFNIHAQLRYNMYTVKAHPDLSFSAPFKNRLLDMADHLINNDTAAARYIGDLIIRDFGTHVITSVEAGGVLEKIDFISNDKKNTIESNKNTYTASAGASLLKVFGAKVGVTVSNEDTNIESYEKDVEKTQVNTHGGPLYYPGMTLKDWETTLPNNLVAIDRSGDPLNMVITPRSLPDIPLPYLTRLASEVKSAIVRYYKSNMNKGCMDPNSPNFDPIATVEGICEATATNFTFGGIYQTCENDGNNELNPCASFIQRNPVTGSLSCSDKYEPVLLFDLVEYQYCQQHCWRHGPFWHRRTSCINACPHYRTYWCSAKKSVQIEAKSGVIFGGLFTDKSVNPTTQAQVCPMYFTPYTIGPGIKICLSASFEDAAKFRTPFAGFYSCHSGNPLAEPGRNVIASARLMAGPNARSTGDAPSNFNNYPRGCPPGYGEHTITVMEKECFIMYCTKITQGIGTLVAKRPPYESVFYGYKGKPVDTIEVSGRKWERNSSESKVWRFMGYSSDYHKIDDDQSDHSDSNSNSRSAWGVLGPLFLTVLILALVVVLIGVMLRRRPELHQRFVDTKDLAVDRCRDVFNRKRPYRNLDSESAHGSQDNLGGQGGLTYGTYVDNGAGGSEQEVDEVAVVPDVHHRCPNSPV